MSTPERPTSSTRDGSMRRWAEMAEQIRATRKTLQKTDLVAA